MKQIILIFILFLATSLLWGCSSGSNGDDDKSDSDNKDVESGDDDDDDDDGGAPAIQVADGGYVTFGPWQGYAWISTPVTGTISPSDFEDAEAGDRLCASGTTEEDYMSNPWLALNVNQEEGDRDKTDSVVPKTNGLYVNVDNVGDTPLRVQLTTDDGTQYCAQLGVFGGTTIAFDSFNTQCWSGEGEYYANEPLESIAILVPGDEAQKFDFEFCLDELAPKNISSDCVDEPIPGDEYTCAQQAGWGKCDESWMEGYCLLSCGKCDEGGAVDTDAVEIDEAFTEDVDTHPDNHPGFRVEGRHLYDRCGEQVILRGVNKMIVWTDKDGDSLPEIEKTGANVVRIVWTTDGSPDDLDAVIGRTLENQMIPMIELHDATGSWNKGDQKDMLGLRDLVDWWVKSDVVDVIQKYETDLLINIGNEVGTAVKDQDFLKGYISAVTRMRDAGIKTPLIIDATNWGQNINILQKLGPTVFNHDPYNNVLFSIHMWWPSEYHDSSEWETVEDRVIGEIKESVEMNLPLIVGEFAHVGASCVEAIPYLTIIEECQANDIGWLAWSWGPGNADCDEMDITSDNTFDGIQEGWGEEVLISDTNSVSNTSVRPYSIVNGECESK
ncbi:MAG: cellulase family glycosylhydrolase [Deltaproteobacteria bacterium]|nr:cellulase family glycosylhydrolase [Deltaproteobacteria bacterium]